MKWVYHETLVSVKCHTSDISVIWKANADKTDLIIIGTKQQRNKIVDYVPVKILGNNISPSDTVWNLGVVFDSNFSFQQYISQVCMFLSYTWFPSNIASFILSSAKTISVVLINSRLDYCNSHQKHIAKKDLSKLQRVLNCLARVVLKTHVSHHHYCYLSSYVLYRIKFKFAIVTYHALSTKQPTYSVYLLHFSNISRTLRS